MSISNELYKISRITGKTASTFNDIKNIAKGHPEKVVKKKLKRAVHKDVNKLFK